LKIFTPLTGEPGALVTRVTPDPGEGMDLPGTTQMEKKWI
jgi:hypothetical protein